MLKKLSTELNLGLAKLTNGGRLYLPVGKYDIDEPIVIDTPCIKLEGEVWNYSSDPNGVFESKYGTKLRLTRKDIPAIFMSRENVLGGNIIKDIGIQGDIVGMDTRGMFNYENPAASAGICFDAKRVDQGEVSKISCCGLAAAVVATGTSEIDACTFEKINADGCCIGIYFAPRASYYAMFRHCIVADTPSYGFFVNGEKAYMHSLDISDMRFVRNGGAFPEDNPYPKAAFCFYKVSKCALRDNVFDAAGTFWYYESNAKSNNERQPSTNSIPALYVEGNKNRIIGNVFSNSSSDSIVIKGNSNIVMNNIVDNNIVIDGSGNIISNSIFTNENAKVILSAESKDNEFIGIPENRIIRR